MEPFRSPSAFCSLTREAKSSLSLAQVPRRRCRTTPSHPLVDHGHLRVIWVTLHTAALVGHDIGLMVAYAYAAQYPGEVSKVVLMDAFLPGVGDWKSVWLMRDLWHFHFHGETPLTEARRPHIVYPGRDMSIALDPDIPAERQRLYPRAEPALPGLAWQIDRVPSISAAGTSPAGWRPVPGRHHLKSEATNGC